MTTITRESAEIKSFITGFLSDAAHDNQSSNSLLANVFRIALASLEAEPVAWKATFTQIDNEYNTFTALYSDKAEVERWVRLHEIGDFRAEITPLYTAQPAPVAPDGWISCSDAVPAEYCDVILCDDLGNVFPGSWDKVFCPIRGGNKMAFVDKDGIEVESSTHWMPLP
ncbi:DUF551 domain-containing protein [Escherichia sp. E4742]|uniref:DUF551 domain-containing protein n=1 Tax=Escherichia sp. E4742 TaxID=2044467 RepID=UPI0010FDFDF9|nr:DUF551 domain-containing protein [Escherichia sp. E4742]QCT85823.1 DUF551 domain-containing protein [Escherichia sp. E4742]TLJ05055.1 DUF551 domain-containing protein [Escherichia sp. E4742]